MKRALRSMLLFSIVMLVLSGCEIPLPNQDPGFHAPSADQQLDLRGRYELNLLYETAIQFVEHGILEIQQFSCPSIAACDVRATYELEQVNGFITFYLTGKYYPDPEEMILEYTLPQQPHKSMRIHFDQFKPTHWLGYFVEFDLEFAPTITEHLPTLAQEYFRGKITNGGRVSAEVVQSF